MEKTRKFIHNGVLISTVERLSEKIEVETVFHGKEKPELLIIYLDADNPNPMGSARPRIRVEMNGDRVADISVFNHPPVKMK